MSTFTKPENALKTAAEDSMAQPLVFTPQYRGAEMIKLAKARRALKVSSVKSLVIPLFLQDKLVYILIFKKLFEYYSLRRKENKLINSNSNVTLTETAVLMLQLLFSIFLFFVSFASVLHLSYYLFLPLPVSLMNLGFLLVQFASTVFFSWFVFWFNLL